MSKKYPILPLRNDVMFPENILALAVGRDKSIRLIQDAVVKSGADSYIVLASQRDEDNEEPTAHDIYSVGVLSRIMKVVKAKDGTLNVIVQGIKRVRITSVIQDDPYFICECEDVQEVILNDSEENLLIEDIKKTAIKVLTSTTNAPKETLQVLEDLKESVKFCDFVAANLGITKEERQEILQTENIKERYKAVLGHLSGKLKEVEVAKDLRESWLKENEKSQKEYYLRNQMKLIKQELGEDEDLDDLETRLETTSMSEEAYAAAKKQFNRLKTMQPSSSEYSVTLNFIETLLDIPWNVYTDDNLDLTNAQKIFDNEHYALLAVKKRLVEYLAVQNLRNDMKSPILCLAGPPGVGKTSISRSIARALGRKFVRISLGGVHDESEIRGHRRTYVGAMPGRIAKALIKAGTCNPVILLDEVDKMGRDMKGDPEAAMLEVLDPEQNHTFSDHFVEVPIDLSNVLFIATANTLGQISGPLRDRMEIIEVPSYTSFEKSQIAVRHLIPKQVEAHGISENNVTITAAGLDYVIDHYTREAGVRGLERQLAGVCRSVAVKVAKLPKEERPSFHVEATPEYIQESLGPEKFFQDVAERVSVAGIATGLAWTQSGGDILFIETSKMEGDGKMKLTGQLGDVMKESAEAALTFLRSNAPQFGLETTFHKNIDLHIHFPAGAVPKDGPSAGITIFTSVLSTLTGICVRNDVAMTGEITLRGNVLPVGGIKEKLTAAHRAGIKRVIIPKKCVKDLVDLAEEVKEGLEIIPVERVEELPELVLDGPLPKIPVVDLTHEDTTPPTTVN